MKAAANKALAYGIWYELTMFYIVVKFNELIEIGKKSFTALGGKSFGRIDIKMNHLGEAHFMEANLMPGLRKGYFYRSCKLNLNINYDEMILNIANTGLTSNNIRH